MAACDGTAGRPGGPGDAAPLGPVPAGSASAGGSAGENPSMRQDLDVAYASQSPAQRLDLYRPAPAADGGPVPLVVLIHGGAFAFGDKGEMDVHVRALVGHGYAVASLNYRMVPEATYPAAVDDVRAAVRWLRAGAPRLGLDAGRFAAFGESAGAYLAAMLGTSGDLPFPGDEALGNVDVPSAVRAVVDLYGPVDFPTMDGQLTANPRCGAGAAVHDAAGSPESRFLGHQITTVPDLVRAASPATHLGAGRTPPRFLLEHGTADCTVPYQQSVAFAGALRAAGGAADLRIVDGAGHGPDFPLADRLPGILAFLDDALR